MEISDKEFRVFIMTKLTEMGEKRDNGLRKRQERGADEFQEVRKFLQDLKEELHALQKSQTELLEMKSIIQEVKISLESMKSRLDHTENRISDTEENIAGPGLPLHFRLSGGICLGSCSGSSFTPCVRYNRILGTSS